MGKIREVVVRELGEAVPPTVFFFLLFHMIALTKAVAVGDYTPTALRAAFTTVLALIVAKAILVVEALPVARRFEGRLLQRVFWKTFLFGSVAILFRFLEEWIPVAIRGTGVVAATEERLVEIPWAMFGVFALWLLGGLFLYCLATELARAIGPAKVRQLLLGP